MKHLLIISLIVIPYIHPQQDPRHPITACYHNDGYRWGYAYFHKDRCELLLMQLPKSYEKHFQKILFTQITQNARKNRCSSIFAKPKDQAEQELYTSLQFKKTEEGMTFPLKR